MNRTIFFSLFSVLLSSLSLILVLTTTTTPFSAVVDATCLTGQGVPLRYKGSAADILPGFYAPNLDPSNSSTYAIACVPTPACQVTRSLSGVCDKEQSPFEPRRCESGKVCYNYSVQVDCPEGYFCADGTFEPVECHPFSICPQGSERPRYLGGIVAMAMIFFTVVVIMILYQYRAPQTPMEKIARASNSDKKQLLSKAMKRARVETQNTSKPIGFQFKDLSVSVKIDGQDEPKKILQGVTGEFQAGRVTACCGPSGAGKTTTFNAVLRKFNNDKFIVTGENKINGTDDPEEIKKLQPGIAYVPQDDVLHTELTVADNVFYASELALPRNWNAEEKAEFREVVLSLTGLSRLRNTKVGTPDQAGLHGGEKKKCAIACQLAGAPAAIFLDEPTSGLDASTSLELIRVLKEVAVAAKICVVVVVHQPRVEIWHALDNLLLLAPGGKTVYEGPANQSVSILGEYLHLRPQDNPADIILDAVSIHGDEMAQKWAAGDWKKMIKNNNNSADDQLSNSSSGAVTPEQSTSVHPLTAPKEKEEEGEDTSKEEKKQVATFNKDHHQQQYESSSRQANPLRQFFLMHTRAIQKVLANYQFLLLEWIILLLTGLILGSAGTLAQPLATYTGEYARISPNMLVTFLPQMFMYIHYSSGLASAVSGVKIFGEEKIRFKAEAEAGFSITAYFFGSSLVTIYRCFVSSLVFSSIVHFIGTWTMDFWLFFANVFLSYLTIGTVGEIVSLLTTQEYAAVIASTLSLVFGALNGFIGFPFWLKVLSYAYWSSNSFYTHWHKTTDHFVDPPYDRWDYRPDEFGDSFCMGILFLNVFFFTSMVWVILKVQYWKV